MFRFENSYYFIGLLIVLAFGVWLYLNIKKRNQILSKFGDAPLIKGLIFNYSAKRKQLKNWLLIIAMTLGVISLANPQWGTKKEKIKTTSADIYLALDVSNSMNATDISPSRLERSKRFCQKLLDELGGNRVGLIFFAGSAYLQMPLTNDIAAAKVVVKAANTNLAGTQGTEISEAIDLALKANPEEEPHAKAIIVISDGENHEESAISAAEKAVENGDIVYTIGVGTETGAFVPVVRNGREEYIKDSQGNPIKSKLNIPMLQDIARAGKGEFFLVSDGDSAINSLLNNLQKIQKREVEQRSFTEFASYYQYFLLLAIILWLIALYLPDAVSNKKSSLV